MGITVHLKFSFTFLQQKLSRSTTERDERRSKYIPSYHKNQTEYVRKANQSRNYNSRNFELWTDIQSLQLNQSSKAF